MRHLLSLGFALVLVLAAHAQSVSIRVVDAASGAAVQGADVRAVVVSHVEERRRERIPLSEIAEWEAEREATKLRAVSDASGAATLDFSAIGVPESYVLLSARSGDLWGGRAIVGTGEGEVELRVEPDFSFDVHVFDASGQPAAGVPVAYTHALPEHSRIPRRMCTALVTSDVRGVARFPHAQDVLRSMSNTTPMLWAAIPTVRPVEIAIDPAISQQPRLELHLPPCGRVRFQFDAGSAGQVRLRRAYPKPFGGGDAWMSMDPWRVPVRDGVALFSHVEPGLELDYLVETPGVDEQKTMQVVGPSGAGETRVVTPGKRPKPRSVVAQLVDRNREPLRDGKVHLDICSHLRTANRSSSSNRGYRKQADADGRLEFNIPSEESGAVELGFSVEGVGEWNGLVPKLADGERLDLGALVLVPIGDPQYLGSLDDDALERELLRIETLAKVTSSAWSALEGLAIEAARRGGERWSSFFRRRLDDHRAAEREDRYSDQTLPDLSWFVLLRRAQRRPDPCRLEVHPDDLKRASFTSPVRLRAAVRNVDPEESFETGTDGCWNVLAEFEPNGAGVRPARRSDPPMRGGPAERFQLRPGEHSAEKFDSGWWDIDLSWQFEVPEGDWLLRLAYSPTIGFDYMTSPVVVKVAAEPFVLRVREERK
ncbi:MAG: hypothetical protein NTV21_18070 [Planctomycetota bacterium]|nr:hypothetical protein [Planctomycetota bacterium]